MKKALFRALALILTGVLMLTIFSACSSQKYKLDFAGQESNFKGAKSAYKEGEKVTLYFPFIATDTDYSFYVDGERVNPGYEEDKGYVIEFTMPAHDVTVGYSSVNSMLALEGYETE